MGFRRKVHHNIRMLLFKEAIYGIPIADIHLHKAEIRLIHHRCQGRQISRVGQLVQTDDTIIRILLHHVKYKIRTNKSGAAGDDDCQYIYLQSS